MKLEAAFSILAVASTASALQIPVTRIRSRAPLLPSLDKRGFAVLAAGGGVSLKNTENNIYTSTMQIKGKGRVVVLFFGVFCINMVLLDVVLQVDTGSSDTWVYPTAATRDLFSDAVVYVCLYFATLHQY
jgi:hypothetical protein